jgi:hypothetical protein
MNNFYPLHIYLQAVDDADIEIGGSWACEDETLLHCQIGDYIRNPACEHDDDTEPPMKGGWIVQSRLWSHFHDYIGKGTIIKSKVPWNRHLTLFVKRA